MPSKAFGPTALVADTKTQIGSAYTMPSGGRVTRIRVCGYNGATDKAEATKLIVETDQQNGPFEYACYPAGGELTVGGKRATDEILFPAIALAKGEIVSIYGTAAEALEDVTVSIEWA